MRPRRAMPLARYLRAAHEVEGVLLARLDLERFDHPATPRQVSEPRVDRYLAGGYADDTEPAVAVGEGLEVAVAKDCDEHHSYAGRGTLHVTHRALDRGWRLQGQRRQGQRVTRFGHGEGLAEPGAIALCNSDEQPVRSVVATELEVALAICGGDSDRGCDRLQFSVDVGTAEQNPRKHRGATIRLHDATAHAARRHHAQLQ